MRHRVAHVRNQRQELGRPELLDRLRDRYGSFRRYADEIGLSDAVTDRLEASLLERDPA